ncbi:MAG: major capsid protein [Candidatus Omnitrophota bacterium]
MAIGKASDFKIKDEEFFAGMNETVSQFADVFNARSNNCIRLIPKLIKGDYEKEAFIKSVSGLIARRDTTTVSSLTDTKLTHDEIVGVKLNRTIGPVGQTLDAFKKLGLDESEFSMALGEQIGEAVALNMVNTGLYGCIGALKKTTSGANQTSYQPYNKTVGSARTTTPANLTQALFLMGDAQNKVLAWVMHSTTAKDLGLQAITDKVDSLYGIYVIQGDFARTLGRPIIITDSPALVTAGVGSSLESYDGYHILGLTEDAIVVAQSEEQTIVSQTITGLANLVLRLQGEYAFNLRIKGFAYGTGGVNPTDATLAAAANWSIVASSKKGCAGVHLYVRAA